MQKMCAGRCGQLKDEEEFDWNRSGYSRKSRCRDCFRADAKDRTAKYRKSKRPDDWQPKYKKVECLGDSHACTLCGTMKNHSDFYVDKTGACGFESRCKVCRQGDRRERWAENRNGHKDKDVVRRSEWTPERRAEWLHSQFNYRLKKSFNITEEQYNWLLEQQSGVCFLCHEPETKLHHKGKGVMRLAIDHDHRCCPESSKSCGNCIRSLLCYSCNMLIGKVELKPALAERFKDYIDRRPLATINIVAPYTKVRAPDGTVEFRTPGFVGMLKSGNPHLASAAKEIVRAPIEREDGSFIPAQRLCWNSGKGGHLCNKKCENEPPYGTTLADLAREAREKQFRQYAEWSDAQIRSLYETRPKTIDRGGRWI